MTNIVAAVTLLVQTNASPILPHPTGLGITVFYTNVTSEVLFYTNAGVARAVTNAVQTNVFEWSYKQLIPPVPPAPNIPRKL